MCETSLHNKVWACAMSPVKNMSKIQSENVTNYGGRFNLPKKTENPFKMGYDPELDAHQ